MAILQNEFSKWIYFCFYDSLTQQMLLPFNGFRLMSKEWRVKEKANNVLAKPRPWDPHDIQYKLKFQSSLNNINTKLDSKFKN